MSDDGPHVVIDCTSGEVRRLPSLDAVREHVAQQDRRHAEAAERRVSESRDRDRD